MFHIFVCCAPQVSFSEGGPGSNSTGSEVASMSSQLPDTPNSMVSSPIEAWAEAACADWTNRPCSSHPSRLHQTTPGCILTLWRQSWDFTTATHSCVHPDGCVIMAGAACSHAWLLFCQKKRHEPDSIDKWDLWVGEQSTYCTLEMLCATLNKKKTGDFFNSIKAPQRYNRPLEGNSTAFLHLITRFPSWPKY